MTFDAEHDVVMAAWSERTKWAELVWVLVKDRRDGRLRIESMQRDEHTATMAALFPFSALAASQMTGAVERALLIERMKKASP